MIEVRTYLPEMGINPDPQESPTRTLEKGNAGLSLWAERQDRPFAFYA